MDHRQNPSAPTLNMRVLLQIIIVLAPTFASKEHVPLRNLPDNEQDILFQLVKRLEKDNNYEYGLGWSGNAQSSQCIVSTNKSSIIKRIDSENNGAAFLTLHDEVETNQACVDLCCKNKTCDLAVYENKGEHHCYLFQCEGKCLFGHHSSYISNSMRHPSPSSQGQQAPPAAADGSELDLMNLDQDSGPDVDSAGSVKNQGQGSLAPSTTTHSPAASVTQAPTAAPYIRAHSVGLEGALCLQNLHCEDPNAVCNYHKCRCREGYYQKGHICRKNCAPSQFGCLELGTLGRGPECVSTSQVCDSVMQCADGSDEFNCPDSGGSYKNEGSLDKDSKTIPQGGSTGKLNGSPVSKPDIAAEGDSLVPGGEGDVSSDSDKDQPSAHQQPPSSSSESDDNNNNNSKQSSALGDDDDNQPPHYHPLNKAGDNKDRDSLAQPMPTEEDKLHSLSKEEDSSSDLAKDSESSPQDDDDPNDLVRSQNAFISRTKLVLPAAETANMQGPIIALSLGLAFTLILLVFVACRLRNVRRRLRKGRPLHSNEADYLINGMYL